MRHTWPLVALMRGWPHSISYSLALATLGCGNERTNNTRLRGRGMRMGRQSIEERGGSQADPALEATLPM